MEEFFRQRFKEKVGLVKAWIPPFLVENAVLHSILSKGVHELTEEECLAAFEPCRTGIELILDEHIASKAQAEKVAQAAKSLHELNSALSKGKSS